MVDAAAAYSVLLENDPGDPYLWYRTAVLVGRLGEIEGATRHLDLVAGHLADGGQLMLALAAARELGRHDAEASRARIRAIAEIFGRGSKRLDARRVTTPPPLPERQGAGAARLPAAGDPRVLREECLDQCEKAAAHWEGLEPDDKVPFHPLLSDLPPSELEALASSMILSVRSPGDVVIEQGAPGSSIFLLVRGGLQVERRVPGGGATHLATLRPGSFFGEMALLTDSPRTAQVTCREAALLVEIERDTLEDLATTHPELGTVLAGYTRHRLLRNLMATSPLFQPLDPGRRSSLIDLFESVVYAAGEQVVVEGEASCHLYVVLTGAVVVTKCEGAEVLTLAELGPGQIFGEISLIKDRAATATDSARDKTVLLTLEREAFNRHVVDFPEVLAHIYKMAVEREETNLRLQSSDTLDVGDDLLI